MFVVKILLIVILNGLLFWLFDTKIFVDEFIVTGSVESYAFIAFVFTVLNTFLHPLLNLITLPFRIITFGAASLLVNAFLLWVLEYSVNFLQLFGAGLEIKNLSTYLFAGVILMVFNVIFHWLRV